MFHATKFSVKINEQVIVETQMGLAIGKVVSVKKNTGIKNAGEPLKMIIRVATKKDIEASYKKTLENVQDQLSAPARAFSKVIHNPVVEKTSDAIGNTVARPNLIISGALGAIASVVVYFIAKRYGYLLSGSETIILFVAGWSIGAVIEYARIGFINNRKNS